MTNACTQQGGSTLENMHASAMEALAYQQLVATDSFAMADTSPAVQYGSFDHRFGAVMVDCLILTLLSLVPKLCFLTLGNEHSMTLLEAISMLIVVLMVLTLSIGYVPWFTSSSWQATPGKRLFGLKVVDERLNPISFGRAFWREMAKGLSFLPLCAGFLMALFTQRHQALHDKMTHTLVIKS